MWHLQVILGAKGRPVVVLNPRTPYMPFEMEEFETVYQLRQYNVQPTKVNPKVKSSASLEGGGTRRSGVVGHCLPYLPRVPSKGGASRRILSSVPLGRRETQHIGVSSSATKAKPGHSFPLSRSSRLVSLFDFIFAFFFFCTFPSAVSLQVALVAWRLGLPELLLSLLLC